MEVNYDLLPIEEIRRIVDRDSIVDLEPWEIEVYTEYHARQRLFELEQQQKMEAYTNHLQEIADISRQLADDTKREFTNMCAAILEGDIYVKPQ